MPLDITWPADGTDPWGAELRNGLDQLQEAVNSVESGTLTEDPEEEGTFLLGGESGAYNPVGIDENGLLPPRAMDAISGRIAGDAADPESEFGAQLSATIGDVVTASVGERLRRSAVRAQGRSSIDLPPLPSPPTIVQETTLANLDTAGLTKTWWVTATPNVYAYRGCSAPIIYAGSYYRFPSVTLPTGAGNASATENAVGFAIEFMTDAPRFYMTVVARSGAFPKIEMEIDGQRVSSDLTFLTPATQPRYYLVDFAGVRKPRRIRIEGNWGIAWRGIATTPADSVWRPVDESQVKVVVAADSIAAQTGAESPNGGYPFVLGKLMGWADVQSVSIGGTGFVNPGTNGSTFGDATRIADVVAARPDLLILTATPNDASTPSATVRTAALAAFQAYRDALPNVPIVVGGLWPGATGPSAAMTDTESAVREAFDAWADRNSWWVPATTDPDGAWLFGTGRVGATNGSGNSDVLVNAADNTHPSPAGHVYAAYRWAAALRAKVLPFVS